MPLYVPGVELLVVEFSEIEIVEESLVDCMCFSDTIKSLISPISSSEALFCTDCSGKICASGGFPQRITGISWI